MRIAARLVSAITALTLLLTAQPDAAQPTQGNPHSHAVEVAHATPAQQALVNWAVGRYEAAVLQLPRITVTFHDTSDGCHGNLGFYDHGARRLDMCNWGQHYKITPASTLLHELGHAWSFEHMSSIERDAFTTYRGLDNWNAHYSWWLRGQEQAAEIIAWGLADESFASPYVDHLDCAELAAAYRLATDSAPISPKAASCAVPRLAFPTDATAFIRTLSLFAKTGLGIPEFRAEFHAVGEPCEDNHGLHVRTSDGASTIHVCYTHERALPQRIARERTLMHEVAHAWLSQHTSELQRAAFLELRDLGVWEGDDVWAANGAEHAAEILLWGMTDGERNINILIPRDDIDQFRAAYAILVAGPA